MLHDQLDGKFSPEQKLEELLTRLSREDPKLGWKDLELGCIEHFGFCAPNMLGHEVVPGIIETANQKGILSFIIAHDIYQERNLRRLFPTEPEVSLKLPHEWLFSEEEMLAYVKDLYNQLGLKDFDEEKILVYYRAYVEKLKEFNRWHPPKYP